jgi:hypothetical protein
MVGDGTKIMARMAVVATAAAFVSAVGLVGAPTARAVTNQAVVGAWAGPVTIGDTADCGRSAGQYAFSPDGSYRYTALYDTCGPVMIDGHYELQADGSVLQLAVEACGDTGCPPGPSVLTTSISASDPDTIVLGGGYTYRRLAG